MSNGFKAELEELAAHSSAVVGLAGRLSEAGETGSSVDLGLGTYGVIGQAFAGQARVQIGVVSNAIKLAGSGLEAIGDNVNNAAETYHRFDETVVDALHRVGSEL